MSIKLEYEQINELCHGCLTEDRTVHRISGEISEMFYGLRNDRNKNRLELALCWECVAFLKKLKVFKARIKTAQCLLMKFIKCYCKNEPVPKLESLSSFAKLHINTFDYEFDEKEKTVFEAQDEKNDILIEYHNKEDVHQTKNLTSEELLTDIKVEYDDTIKEEYNSSNDNDSDYYEPVLKFEVEDSEDKPSTVKKYTRSCTKYQRFATVTRRKDISKKTYLQFAESVSLDRREYEKVLKRDRIRYSYPRMPFKCDECREGYLKKIDLQCHNSFGHSNESTFPYKCADCPTMVTSLEQQEQHWAAAHSKQYKCMICTEVHQSVAEIKKHIRMKHRKNYTCNECGFDCGSLYEFRKHYQMTHERVICDYCNGVFMKKRSLISHIQLFHIPAFCGICNRTYTNHKTYKYHNQITHPELTAGSEVRKELSYCVECDKQYPTEHKYKLHLKQSVKHTKQKIVRVPCPDCGKIFTRTSFMNNHYRLVHLKVTKHYCDQCDKYYTTGYGLRQHIERVHKKIALPKDKMCDLCGRGFASNKILINHRRTHTGERPYKCQYCPAAFAQRTAMKTHEKSQHKNLDLSGQPTGPYEGPIRASGLGALPTSTAGRYTC